MPWCIWVLTSRLHFRKVVLLLLSTRMGLFLSINTALFLILFEIVRYIMNMVYFVTQCILLNKEIFFSFKKKLEVFHLQCILHVISKSLLLLENSFASDFFSKMWDEHIFLFLCTRQQIDTRLLSKQYRMLNCIFHITWQNI